MRIGSLAAFPALVFLTAATFRAAPEPLPEAPHPAARVPQPGERVLVFAPHPDDEVIAVGGLIADARRRRAAVRVAYLTSGDAFRLCAAATLRRWPGPDAMDGLGQMREQEARHALRRLGLSEDAGTFLRFPDRGLASLWLENWSGAPYRSPYTGRTGTNGAPYTGRALLAELEQLLRREQPDFVYYPDPADDHPDHWAGHCFVRMALERAHRSEQQGPIARTYLVHRGEWPRPVGEDHAPLLRAPGALAERGGGWETVALSASAMTAKRSALEAHRSQTMAAGEFLRGFLRRNELLSLWASVSAPGPVGRSQPGGSAAGLDAFSRERPVIGDGDNLPPGMAPVSLQDSIFPDEVLSAAAGAEPRAAEIPDSTGDRWARAQCGAVDFTGMEVEQAADGVLLRARLRADYASWPEYRLYWKPLDVDPTRAQTRALRLSAFKCAPTGSRFSIRGDELQAVIPRSEVGASRRVMVAAEAWAGPLLLDRSPWRVVLLAP